VLGNLLDMLVLFGLEVGKWLGPLRAHMASGAGTAQCSRSVCTPMKSDSPDGVPNQRYYVPLLAGVGGTLFQLGPIAFEGKLQYRVAFTAAETFDGLSRIFLHGPVATPSIMYAGRDPIVPGIRGGTRHGVGLGVQVPLAYVMSGRGDGSFSVGASLMFLFPIH
jgi:hypothetical protein